MVEPKYKRVLLKISGEALAGDARRGLDFDIIGGVCDVIKRCVQADKIIALNDIAQVANGLVATATAGQKERADMDESGSVLTSDMTYVVDAYGARSMQQSYQKFMEASVA